MVGLDNAISIGNCRIVHLLLWAGMSEHVCLDTILRATQSSCINRRSVIREVVSWWVLKNHMNKEECRRIGQEMARMNRDAERNSDKDMMESVKAILGQIDLDLKVCCQMRRRLQLCCSVD